MLGRLGRPSPVHFPWLRVVWNSDVSPHGKARESGAVWKSASYPANPKSFEMHGLHRSDLRSVDGHFDQFEGDIPFQEPECEPQTDFGFRHPLFFNHVDSVRLTFRIRRGGRAPDVPVQQLPTRPPSPACSGWAAVPVPTTACGKLRAEEQDVERLNP